MFYRGIEKRHKPHMNKIRLPMAGKLNRGLYD